MKKSAWYYESDGEQNARTHYCWRYNIKARGGIERKDFATKAEAFKFLDSLEKVEVAGHVIYREAQ